MGKNSSKELSPEKRKKANKKLTPEELEYLTKNTYCRFTLVFETHKFSSHSKGIEKMVQRFCEGLSNGRAQTGGVSEYLQAIFPQR